MAQNITIAGASYEAVPSIIVPKTGGGEAEYHDMADPMSFLGKDVELVNDNLYFAEYTLADTAFNTWTPSSTAQVCVASVTKNSKFTATDLPNYEYYLCWECGCDPVYDGTQTLKALTTQSRAFLIQEIFRRPTSSTNIGNKNYNGDVCNSAFTQTFMRYYGTTTGSLTYTWSASYGFYFGLVASTFSSTTSDSPNINLKTPTMSARCSTTYLSTTNAGKIDKDASKCWIKGKLYRVKRNGWLRGATEQAVRLINDTPPYSANE